MTRQETEDRLIRDGLLRQVLQLHNGTRALRCMVCGGLDDHRDDCSVKARMDAASAA